LARGHARFFSVQFGWLPTRLGWRVWIFHAPDERTNSGQENSHNKNNGDKHHQITEADSWTRHEQSLGSQFDGKTNHPIASPSNPLIVR
jgi:hypothetical protein